MIDQFIRGGCAPSSTNLLSQVPTKKLTLIARLLPPPPMPFLFLGFLSSAPFLSFPYSFSFSLFPFSLFLLMYSIQGEAHHMHTYGKSSWTNFIRGGNVIRRYETLTYDYNSQKMLPTNYDVLPGDTIQY